MFNIIIIRRRNNTENNINKWRNEENNEGLSCGKKYDFIK